MIIIFNMILILSLIAAAGFVGATLLVDTTLGTSRRFHHYSVVIAAGILLGVTLADLLPEALELLDATDAALAIAAGFIALFVVEQLTSAHTHHHEPHGSHDAAHGHAHGHTHASSANHRTTGADIGCVPTHAIVPFLIGLGIHNLADGVVIGASHEVSDAASSSVAIGILVHQLPVGLSFAAVLLASGIARGRMVRNALLVAAPIPVGALVVLTVPGLGESTLGALIGVAAGALLYIATGHLLPEAQSEERRPGIAAAFAVALTGTILFVGALHETTGGDQHAGEGEHAGETEEDEHA